MNPLGGAGGAKEEGAHLVELVAEVDGVQAGEALSGRLWGGMRRDVLVALEIREHDDLQAHVVSTAEGGTAQQGRRRDASFQLAREGLRSGTHKEDCCEEEYGTHDDRKEEDPCLAALSNQGGRR